MSALQDVELYKIKESDVVEKRIGFENGKGVFTGQYTVINIIFTGTEDVAVLQHLHTKSVECVDVALLRKLPQSTLNMSIVEQGNVVRFGRR